LWGSGCIDTHFLDLGTSWRIVVSFTPRPLYSRGKSPRYPLDRRLNGKFQYIVYKKTVNGPYAAFNYPMRAIRLSHLVLNVIAVIMFSEEHEL
jgi:hypothetical protein